MVQRKRETRAKVPARVGISVEAKDALAEVADELAALRAEDVLSVNVDVARSVSIALGAEPQLRAYVEQIGALPESDVKSLSRLRTYALAALYANLDAQPVAGPNQLNELVAEGTPVKQRLVVAAQALAHAGLVDGERLDEIISGQGHLDLASDLVALGALFDSAWEHVQDKTFLSIAEVERASQIGTDLLVALGVKNHSASRATPEAVDRRDRAFTLLFRTYDEARRALTYLRWHEDDVDLIAPSLYKRSRRRAAVAGPVDATQEAESAEKTKEVAPDEEASTVESVRPSAAAVAEA